MRAPPPVEFTSMLGRFWRGVLSLLVGASTASTLAWALPHVAALAGNSQRAPWLDALADPVAEAVLALAMGAIACIGFWQSCRKMAAGERTLRWDGQDWVLAADAIDRPDQRGDAALMLDLGAWMLVRFVPYATTGLGAGTWLPLELGGDRARWAALRGALWNWRGESRAGAGRP